MSTIELSSDSSSDSMIAVTTRAVGAGVGFLGAGGGRGGAGVGVCGGAGDGFAGGVVNCGFGMKVDVGGLPALARCTSRWSLPQSVLECGIRWK